MIFDFIKFGKKLFFVSLFFIFFSFFLFFFKGFNFGLEFVGGIEINLNIDKLSDLNDIKHNLSNFKNLKIIYVGTTKSVQIKFKDYDNYHLIVSNISKIKNCKFTKVNIISSIVNKNTIKNTLNAIFFAIFFMLIYLTIRFKYNFSISAILALFHDIILTLGFISFFNLEFDIVLLSALFAIFGYSINDTVIIFDRIRNDIKFNIYSNYYDLINSAVSKTLSRTFTTSISTLFVTLILLIFGGEYLFSFSLVLSFGIIIGTYSSLFISILPLLYFFNSKINNSRIERKVWTPRN